MPLTHVPRIDERTKFTFVVAQDRKTESKLMDIFKSLVGKDSMILVCQADDTIEISQMVKKHRSLKHLKDREFLSTIICFGMPHTHQHVVQISTWCTNAKLVFIASLSGQTENKYYVSLLNAFMEFQSLGWMTALCTEEAAFRETVSKVLLALDIPAQQYARWIRNCGDESHPAYWLINATETNVPRQTDRPEIPNIGAITRGLPPRAFAAVT